MKTLLLFSFLTLAYSLTLPAAILDGKTLSPVSLEQAIQNLHTGSVVIVSEIHNSDLHHQNQVTMLKALAPKFTNISVGMEFFEEQNQNFVDQFLANTLNENDFLKAIGWSNSQPFAPYKEQVLFPITHGGKTYAINASRKLTGKIATSGIDSLTTDEKAQLPITLEKGNDLYFERFSEVMAGHVTPAQLENYFWAQSVWDDTMATQIAHALVTNPQQIIVVIVGDFHAAYGGGLPDRLQKHGVPATTFSQVLLSGLTSQERDETLQVHPKYGPRANYIWTDEN